MPIKTTRLNAQDCKHLIDKIVARIRTLGARKLSYAGRLVLVRAVLKTLHNYWGQMFILPTGIITSIEQVCRNFLWDGGVDYLRSPLVVWDKVCRPKKEGGLGLKQDIIWNKAAVGKLVWWIYTKPDLLWVKWVNNIYLRGSVWQDYSPSTNSSWYWRKICQVMEDLQLAYQQQIWDLTANRYTISKGYEFLRVKSQDVPWSELVWNVWTIPKHAFVAWIHHHGNMNTKSKLRQLGISDDSTCCICGISEETREHLSFDCPYSKRLILQIGGWLGIKFPANNWISWRLGRNGSQVQKGILDAAINAYIYHIWYQRNRSRYELMIIRPHKIARTIKEELRLRFRGLDRRRLSRRDANWILEILSNET
ncbi:uncharacterized protein LOC141640995 [Silene latifolia]|uniref:uncharacterized protein LOC141640995 n=1 Tax=Silene latifolia TaxID=37657 RepID=UPI003D773401